MTSVNWHRFPAMSVAIAVLVLAVSLSCAPDDSGQEGRDKVEAYIAVMEMPWSEVSQRGSELDDAIRGLAAAGDVAAEAILVHYRQVDASVSYRQHAIRALEAIGTKRAAAILLDIALGNVVDGDTSSTKEVAARAWLRLIKDKAKASSLLQSDNPRIQVIGLRGMQGAPITAGLLGRLRELLVSAHPQVVWATANVLADEPADASAAEKVQMIINAIGTLEDQKFDDNRLTQMGSDWSSLERTHHTFIMALSKMRAAEVPLQEATPGLQDASWRIVVIARAFRGDTKVKSSLKSILTDDGGGLFRVWAAEAMGVVGAREDIALLETVAKTDPLERKRLMDVGPISESAYYPVREAARRAVEVIEARTAVR